MRITNIAFILAVLATPAAAFSPEEPVKALVDATVDNWAGVNEEFTFVLGETMLNTVYSKAFAKAYRDAKAKITADAGDGEDYEPFGYDIITNSQDGCPLQDVKSNIASSAGGKAEVVVSFKHFSCMGDQKEYQLLNVVHFDVVEEGGRAVVDNIRHQGDDGEQSLRDDLEDILQGR
jgi:hypothetical protein